MKVAFSVHYQGLSIPENSIPLVNLLLAVTSNIFVTLYATFYHAFCVPTCVFF